jgi:hypothetical protein
MMIVRPRKKYGLASRMPNFSGPMFGGLAILLMPRLPPNHSALFAEMRMISPKPRVTIAR